MSKNPSRRALASILTVIASSAAFADEAAAPMDRGFLSESALVKNVGIFVYPLRIGKSGHVLPAINLGKTDTYYSITESGLVEMKRISNAPAELLDVHSCGAKETAFPWQVKDGSEKKLSPFLVYGKPGEFDARWIPVAKPSTKNPSCDFAKEGLKIENSEISLVPGEDDKFFAVFLGPTVKKKKKSSPDPEDVMNAGCSPKLGWVHRIGRVSGKTCTTLFEETLNCEGIGPNTGTINEPIGLLDLKRGSITERWLVFNARGYEGDAYFAIRLSEEGKVDKKRDIHFYVYSGC